MTEETIKLYDIPRNSRIDCELDDGSTYLTFDHLDGMYSYCTTEKGGVMHLRGGAPLEKIGEKHYKLID